MAQHDSEQGITLSTNCVQQRNYISHTVNLEDQASRTQYAKQFDNIDADLNNIFLMKLDRAKDYHVQALKKDQVDNANVALWATVLVTAVEVLSELYHCLRFCKSCC